MATPMTHFVRYERLPVPLTPPEPPTFDPLPEDIAAFGRALIVEQSRFFKMPVFPLLLGSPRTKHGAMHRRFA